MKQSLRQQKKVSYRILALLFSLITTFTAVIPVSAATYYNGVEIGLENPYGNTAVYNSSTGQNEELPAGLDSEDRERFSITPQEKVYLDQYTNQLYSQLKEARDQGERGFQIWIQFTTPNSFLNNRSIAELPGLLIQSLGTKDAYLRSACHITHNTIDAHFNKEPFEVSLNVAVLTTLDQEKYVDQQVAKITKSLKLSNKSEKDKLKAIYNYVRKNVIYDDSLEATSLQNTAYGALKYKHSLCKGMAALFYRLARQAGISSVNLEFGYIGKKTSHVWCTYKGKIIDCAHSSAHDGFLFYTPKDQFLINSYYTRQYIPFISDDGLNFALDGDAIYSLYKKICTNWNLTPVPQESYYQYYDNIVNSDDITAGFETEFGS